MSNWFRFKADRPAALFVLAIFAVQLAVTALAAAVAARMLVRPGAPVRPGTQDPAQAGGEPHARARR